MNKSVKTYCLRSLHQLWRHQLTQQYYLFIYFNVLFSVHRFLNVQKSLGGRTKNSATLQ